MSMDTLQPDHLPNLRGPLLKVCGEIVPIDEQFSLLSPLSPGFGREQAEFYSMKLDAHIVMFEEDGNVAKRQTQLKDKGVSLLPDMKLADKMLLLVPEGARSLRRLLPHAMKNMSVYSVIFEQAGLLLRNLEHSGFGLPSGNQLLNQLIFAPDVSVQTGEKQYYFPQAELGHITSETVISQFRDSLLTVENIPAEAADYIAEKVVHGWRTIG